MYCTHQSPEKQCPICTGQLPVGTVCEIVVKDALEGKVHSLAIIRYWDNHQKIYECDVVIKKDVNHPLHQGNVHWWAIDPKDIKNAWFVIEPPEEMHRYPR